MDESAKDISQNRRGAGEFDAFISYSRAADADLAPALAKELRRCGKRWDLKVCCDLSDFEISSDLPAEIQLKLKSSRSLLLLASPKSAESKWVEQEIRYWLAHKPADRLFIVLTAGELQWGTEGWDPEKTTALSPPLQKLFKHQALWANLTGARTDADLRRPEFALQIAKLTAGVLEVPLKAVYDEVAEQNRKERFRLKAIAAGLGVLALVAAATALISSQAKRTADKAAAYIQSQLDDEARKRAQAEAAAQHETERRRKNEASVQLAGKAVSVMRKDRELGRLLAIEAAKMAPTREAENALRASLIHLEEPLVLDAGADEILSVEFSPDGRSLLTSSHDATVRLWDVATATNRWTFASRKTDDEVIGSFSRDGSLVFIKSKRGQIFGGAWQNTGAFELHSAATGARLSAVTNRLAIDGALSPDNELIATADMDFHTRIWNAHTGALQSELSGHEGEVIAVDFSTNGNWLVSGSWDGTARVWEVSTGRNLAVLRAQKRLEGASFSPDGKYVLTLSADKAGEGKYLQLWDWIKTPGGPIASFTEDEGIVNEVNFSSDGTRLVSASTAKTARIWDSATGKCLHVLQGHEESVEGVAVSPDGKWVVTVSSDRTGKIWDIETGEALMPLGWNQFPRSCVAFGPEGNRIATGTSGGGVAVYSYEILGDIITLESMALTNVTRQLTQEERRQYLSADAR